MKFTFRSNKTSIEHIPISFCFMKSHFRINSYFLLLLQERTSGGRYWHGEISLTVIHRQCSCWLLKTLYLKAPEVIAVILVII